MHNLSDMKRAMCQWRGRPHGMSGQRTGLDDLREEPELQVSDWLNQHHLIAVGGEDRGARVVQPTAGWSAIVVDLKSREKSLGLGE